MKLIHIPTEPSGAHCAINAEDVMMINRVLTTVQSGRRKPRVEESTRIVMHNGSAVTVAIPYARVLRRLDPGFLELTRG